MNINFSNIAQNIKLQAFTILVGALFFYRLFFSIESPLFRFINELAVVLAISAFAVYLIEQNSSRKINPLSMVMNVGIINAIIFFITIFADDIFGSLFSNITEETLSPDLIFNFVWFFYIFLLAGSLAYFFAALKEFYFLKQKII